MTRRTSDTLRPTLEALLMRLLDSLIAPDTPARAELFVGDDSHGVRLAEAVRGHATPAEVVESADWPLEVSGEQVGFVRLSVPGAAHEGAGETPAEITAKLARKEPHVADLVASLADIAALAEYFHDAQEACSRHHSA